MSPTTGATSKASLNALLTSSGIVPPEIKKLVNNKTEQSYAILEEYYSKTFPRPTVKYDLRGTVAGQARYSTNTIRLNINYLLSDEHRDRIIEITLPHEIAHLVADHLWDRVNIRPHGFEWGNVMQALSLPANRTHNMPVIPARRTRKFEYYCNCRVHKIGLNRHRKIQSGRIFYCKLCGSDLFFQGECEC